MELNPYEEDQNENKEIILKDLESLSPLETVKLLKRQSTVFSKCAAI